ncbi:hypothetical protein DPEC_G00278410 [Dallia pectoralis]|uniref:Uncharacterized protein n=1 Tax=Dallia pectoralis TaxID=75939 RepID=A0ACC2FM10_DALPE|nr:hypothetical protein DPEC_G00278410 [Dallia pectoralis]
MHLRNRDDDTQREAALVLGPPWRLPPWCLVVAAVLLRRQQMTNPPGPQWAIVSGKMWGHICPLKLPSPYVVDAASTHPPPTVQSSPVL